MSSAVAVLAMPPLLLRPSLWLVQVVIALAVIGAVIFLVIDNLR